MVANLKSTEGRCPLTGKKTFATALAAVLVSEDVARKVHFIAVERGGGPVKADIIFEQPSSTIGVSAFGLRSTPRDSRIEVEVSLVLAFEALARIIGAKK